MYKNEIPGTSKTIYGLRICLKLRDALLMVLYNKRLKNPDKVFFFYDILRDAFIDYIGLHPQYHDSAFDFETFKKDYYEHDSRSKGVNI